MSVNTRKFLEEVLAGDGAGGSGKDTVMAGVWLEMRGQVAVLAGSTHTL